MTYQPLQSEETVTKPVARTPAAEWREKGEPDPHGTRYDCEREALCMGALSDDVLANAVFMHGDQRPPIADLISGKAHSPVAWLTAAKDRIRWLSRRLVRAQGMADEYQAWIDFFHAGNGDYNDFLRSIVAGVAAVCSDEPGTRNGGSQHG